MNISSSPSKSGTYLYCIARAQPFSEGSLPLVAKPIGEATSPVYVVPFMDLAAIVNDAAVTHYDISRQNTMGHQLVVEEVMRRSDVLPVRFGTFGRNVQEIQDKLLQRKFGELHHLLDYVQGRVELGVKVFWNRDRLFADLAAGDPSIRALRDEIVGRSPEEAHYERIQLGQLTEQAIVRQRDRDAEAIVEALRPLAAETKVNKTLTDMMVLNAAFLVNRSQEADFDAKVNALDEAGAGRLIFKYVGPVPPYNFVNIHVLWEED